MLVKWFGKLINRKCLAQILADNENVRESNQVKILKFQNKSKASEVAQQLLAEALKLIEERKSLQLQVA